MWIFESTQQNNSVQLSQKTRDSIARFCTKLSTGLLIGSVWFLGASSSVVGQDAITSWQAPNTESVKAQAAEAVNFSPIPPLPGVAPASTGFTLSQEVAPIPSVNATIVRSRPAQAVQTPTDTPIPKTVQRNSGLSSIQMAGGNMLHTALQNSFHETSQNGLSAEKQSMTQQVGFTQPIQAGSQDQEGSNRRLIGKFGPQSQSMPGLTAETTIYFDEDTSEYVFIGSEADVAIARTALQRIMAESEAAENAAQDPVAMPGDEDANRRLVGTFGPQDDNIPGLTGETTIYFDENTGEYVFIGSDEDVANARAALLRILGESGASEKKSAFVGLKYSTSEEILETVQEIYNENHAPTAGKADIRALKSPNGLFVSGQQEAIDAVKKIVTEMEAGAGDEGAQAGVSRFFLQHISSIDAKRRLDTYFGLLGDGGENALPPEAVTIVSDPRANVVVVKGAPQLVRQAEAIIKAIDIDTEAQAVDEVRVFRLQNTVAADLQAILQDAINGQLLGAGQGFNPNQNLNNNNQNFAESDENSNQIRQSRLQLKSIDKDGNKIESGLLFNVRISAEAASNSLIVRGPESAMPLIAELIDQLDRLPDAETQIKVFQVINGDAQQLLDMLEQIFGTDQNANANAGNGNTSLAELPLQTAGGSKGSALVDLRFAVEQRTNSIIATGSASELQVVETLLNRLDENSGTRRQTIVYRLSNSPVLDVAEALNSWLTAQNERIQSDPRSSGGAVQANLGIVVTAEVVSNSLLINALPENFPELERVIQSLDRRPPMVKVECLIAEVNLGALEEFGVELGLQDSLLFDRGTSVAADGGITGIGFPFNTNETINRNATFPESLAGQALSNLGVGKINSELGYGGLVLSAGNESINLLIRALKDKQCLRVLSRPTIMTLENLQGRTSVGQLVPRISGSSQNAIGGGVTNDVSDVSVGVILEVTPRVSPDGMIVMFVNAVKSSLGSEADGVAVAVDATGNPVRQAPINSTEAQTTIMARSGQTVVFSGLIQETKQHGERGTPILSDLPIIGPLFKFESDQANRSELLIIMTPYLVDGDNDIEMHNRAEMDRMHWCLCDVAEVYGNMNYEGFQEDQGAMNTYYPDQDPSGLQPQSSQQVEEVYGQPLSNNQRQSGGVQRASGESDGSQRVQQADFEQTRKAPAETGGFFSELSRRNKSRRAKRSIPGNRSGFDEFKSQFNKK